MTDGEGRQTTTCVCRRPTTKYLRASASVQGHAVGNEEIERYDTQTFHLINTDIVEHVMEVVPLNEKQPLTSLEGTNAHRKKRKLRDTA